MFGFGKSRKTISENPINPGTLQKIKNCAADADRLLGIQVASSDTLSIITAINTYVTKWQKGERPATPTDLDDSHLTLGALWGEQLVAAFGWQWASVVFHEHNNSKATGVFARDRSLAVYPFHFLLGCMRDPGVTPTVLLAYNMLVAGKIPPQPPGIYQNLMDGVRHIVPPG